MREMLLKYVQYNLWANQRLLDIISEHCSDEQLNRELVSSFPTIRKTLLHIWGAESVWLIRLNGSSPNAWTWMQYEGSQDELKKEILNNDQAWIDFVQDKDEKFLSAVFDYKTLDGKEYSSKRSETIHHCMNHSTFHRGQLVTMLREVGITNLVSTDFIAFCRI
ncbi:MAG: DinB family protein [Bacteroidia bacterium]|nr:DinB family protein [Bacteroidia bacterium]